LYYYGGAGTPIQVSSCGLRHPPLEPLYAEFGHALSGSWAPAVVLGIGAVGPQDPADLGPSRAPRRGDCVLCARPRLDPVTKPAAEPAPGARDPRQLNAERRRVGPRGSSRFDL